MRRAPSAFWRSCWIGLCGALAFGCQFYQPPLQRPDECTACHGSAESAAPPRDLDAEWDAAKITVGAHQVHLGTFPDRVTLECGICHTVPEDVDDPEHLGPRPAEVVLDDTVRIDGEPSAWDPVSATCSNLWCHGAGLSGGRDLGPAWNAPREARLACDACHGFPPPPPHIQSEACGACHADPRVSGQQHIDGVVQVTEPECSGCHGAGDLGVPPPDLSGSTDTASVTVGAHRAHVEGTTLRAPLPCETCHLVPATVEDAGHLGDPPAEVVFDDLARADGVEATWDPQTGTCVTYCHGATLEGGSLTDPDWTVVDGSQAACGTCHGIPPNERWQHSTDRCEGCHFPTMTSAGLDPTAGTHIDGQVNFTGTGCTDCHGSEDGGPAPPLDLDRAEASPAVGAHQAHLVAGRVRLPIACAECHVVPDGWWSAGHIDAAPAEVFEPGGPLATAGGATPIYDATTLTCSGTYCHGATLGGGVATEPSWTGDDSVLGCGSCHGFPPPPPHPRDGSCGGCHGGTLADGGIDLAGGLHINGIVDAPLDCTTCHARPQGPRRPVVEEFPDAHGHLSAGGLTAADCGVCHSPDDHRDGWVDLLHPDDGSTIRFVAAVDVMPDPDVSDFCLGCHDADGAQRLPDPADPFGTGVAPPEVASRFAGTLQWNEWYGDFCFGDEGTWRPVNAHHDVSDADQAVSGARLECTSCHGAHAVSAEATLGDPDDPSVIWGGTDNDFCLACHGGGAGPLNPAMPPGVVAPVVEVPIDPDSDYPPYGFPCESPYGACDGLETVLVSGLRPFESCDSWGRPWTMQYTWDHAAHGTDSKRAWPGYRPTSTLECADDVTCTDALGQGWHCGADDFCEADPAPAAELDCQTCHDPHGSVTEDNPQGNPYAIRDVVDGTPYVDDGSRAGSWFGPPWNLTGELSEVVVTVDGGDVDWVPLCETCHADWAPAGAFWHYCTACQTCHGHGQAWGANDWEGGANDTPCPAP